MAKKNKFNYYVVWHGHFPGVYDNRKKANESINGFPNGKWLGFTSHDEAVFAYRMPYEKYLEDYRRKNIMGSRGKSIPLF